MRAPLAIAVDGGTVALVAMASDFVPYGRASYSRADQRGRPGLNPLSVIRERVFLWPGRIVNRLRALARFIGRRPTKVEAAPFRLGFHFIGSARSWRVVPSDLEANLAAISEAASNAEIVVASVHAHGQGPWLEDFARQAIERGAHMVFVHGQHRILGIELYRGRPIFYSMGDFVYEVEHISRFPAEEYARLGLAPDATLSDWKAAKRKRGLPRKRRVFEGFTTSICVSGGRVSQIRLIPTDLQFDAGGEDRGRPQLASPELGRRIVETVAQRSRRYGTSIRYDAETNRGEVALEPPGGVPGHP
jgi:hypothetical protein